MLASSLKPEPLVHLQDNRSDRAIFHPQNEDEYLYAMAKVSHAVAQFLKQNTQPFSGIKVAELKADFEQVDFTKPHNNYDDLLTEVNQLYTKHAVSFHHTEYIAHLNCPVVIPAVAAEAMISSINSSLDTWDQSAGGTLMEQKLINWTCKEIGFTEQADGIFTSGGTQSNLMALLLARDYYSITHLNHNIKVNGLPAEAMRFKIFVSDKAHFSIQKNASLLGLGEKAVVKIKTDCNFKMNTVLLEDALQLELAKGNIPIAVVGTAGTTDFGSIDPLKEIGRICQKYHVWYHVDAAYGCGLLLSDKHRKLIDGIETANSVTVDYHKSFFQPVSSSGFLVNDKKFFSLITLYADYLNPKDHDEDGLPNQVNKSIQTTRRFDALKLWFTLRLMGKQQLGNYIDKIINTAAETEKILQQDTGFELANETGISALVFRYHPKCIGVNICALNQYIKKAMFNEGKALVAGTKINQQFYLKFTLLNPFTSTTHILNILNLIKKHGNEYLQYHSTGADFRRN